MAVKTHFKIVFRGVFNNTPEEWSFSTKWSRSVGAGGDAGTGDISESGVNAALSAFMNTAAFADNVWCTGWRAYQIGTNNKAETEPKIVEFAPGSEIKGTGSLRYPPDVALCVTTVAPFRGHARFGRFYLPGPTTGLASDMRLSQASALSWRDNVVTFLKAVSDAIDLPGTIDSSEMLNVSNDASSTFHTVETIRVGRVLDRVSRRRRSMEEAYEESGTIDW